MKNAVCEVNGHQIHVEGREEGRYMVYTYWVQVGPRWNDTKTWKTLKGAIKWCETHDPN